MNKILKTVAKRSGRIILWTGAIILGAFLLLHIAFWSSLWWINNTQSGQSFLQARLGEQLKGSGYHVQFTGFSYAFPTMLRLGGIRVTQNEHPFIDAKVLKLQIDILPLSEKHASVYFNAQEIIIYPVKLDTPAPKKTAPFSPIVIEPFTFPQTMIESIGVLAVVDRLVVKGDQDIVLKAEASADIELPQNEISVKISINQAEGNKAEIPNTIKGALSFNTNATELKLSSLKMSDPSYNVSIKGGAIFQADKVFDFKIVATPKGISGLSPVKANINIKNTESFPISITAQTQYQKYPASLITSLHLKDANIIANPINISLPEVSIFGAMNYNMNNAALNGKISAHVQNFKPYREFVAPSHNIKPIDLDITLSPKVIDIQMHCAGYSNKGFNVAVQDIAMNAQFADQIITVKSLNMKDADQGTMDIQGTYSLLTGLFAFTVNADKLNAIKGDLANGIISADITAKGDAQNIDVTGTIKPDRVTIKLPDKIAGSIPVLNVIKPEQKNAAPPQAQRVKLNVLVDASDKILVTGYGLDAEFGGKLKITGTAKKPLVNGNLDILHGRFAKFGKKFDVTKGQLIFLGTVPPSPSLDILVESQTADIIAQIAITGNALLPKISFSSDPPLPEDEVMAKLLFGEGVENLSPFQAAQLAQELTGGMGGGGSVSLDPIGAIKSVTGLDDIRIDAAGGVASFGASKQISDKVRINVDAGSDPGSAGATLEIELTPSIKIESEIGADAQGGAGIFWERDY